MTITWYKRCLSTELTGIGVELHTSELELNCLRDFVPESELNWNWYYRNWNWNWIAKTELTPTLGLVAHSQHGGIEGFLYCWMHIVTTQSAPQHQRPTAQDGHWHVSYRPCRVSDRPYTAVIVVVRCRWCLAHVYGSVDTITAQLQCGPAGCKLQWHHWIILIMWMSQSFTVTIVSSSQTSRNMRHGESWTWHTSALLEDSSASVMYVIWITPPTKSNSQNPPACGQCIQCSGNNSCSCTVTVAVPVQCECAVSIICHSLTVSVSVTVSHSQGYTASLERA